MSTASDRVLFAARRLVWKLARRPGPPPGVDAEAVIALYNRGMQLVDAGDCDQALKVAQKLHKFKFTGAFELEAAARHESGDTEAAIGVLTLSIETKPVWRNGHLLGIYLSETRRYEEALAAFDASLKMHAPEVEPTAYNRAIALDRSGRTADAVCELERMLLAPSAAADPETIRLARNFLDKLKRNGPDAPMRRRRSVHRVRARR